MNKEIDELMALVAHEFIQHLITENMLLLGRKSRPATGKVGGRYGNRTIKPLHISNRYIFKGSLMMQTALHIGGGRVTLSSSDSPVVLTPEEIPFIPGSSFKGSLAEHC